MNRHGHTELIREGLPYVLCNLLSLAGDWLPVPSNLNVVPVLSDSIDGL